MKIKDVRPCIVQDERMDDEIGYHSSRALAELDQARRCPDLHAARSHLRLAEEHLARMRSLSGVEAERGGAAPPLA